MNLNQGIFLGLVVGSFLKCTIYVWQYWSSCFWTQPYPHLKLNIWQSLLLAVQNWTVHIRKYIVIKIIYTWSFQHICHYSKLHPSDILGVRCWFILKMQRPTIPTPQIKRMAISIHHYPKWNMNPFKIFVIMISKVLLPKPPKHIGFRPLTQGNILWVRWTLDVGSHATIEDTGLGGPSTKQRRVPICNSSYRVNVEKNTCHLNMSFCW